MRQYINLFEDVDYQQYTDLVGFNFDEEVNPNTPFNVSKAKLTSLNGSPKIVHNSFYCDHNYLSTLENGPEIVTGFFKCNDNRLVSLKGCPKQIGTYFVCHNNPNLTPWEMRYILFSNIGNLFESDYPEVDNIVNPFMVLSEQAKHEQIHEEMARLKKIKVKR